MNNSQWQVSTFMTEKVPHDLWNKFLKLMVEWDGSPSVRYAFYDYDVLKMKLKEAKEW